MEGKELQENLALVKGSIVVGTAWASVDCSHGCPLNSILSTFPHKSLNANTEILGSAIDWYSKRCFEEDLV